jgi:RNA polymerase sigma factor (sigma-70 family)
MSPFDPKKPSPGDEANGDQARQLTTAGGVKVIVRAEAPPARTPPPPEASPPVVVFPPGQSAEERAAFLDALCRRHLRFVDRTLLARGDVQQASAEDLRQEVLLIFCRLVDTMEQLPDNQEGYLVGVIRNVVRNHKREKGRPVPVGVPDSGAAVDDAPDPEEAVALAEIREKLRRYLHLLPQVEAEVVRRAVLESMTLEAVAEALGRPLTTVFDQLARARDRLRELALASRRAAELRRSAASLPAHLAPASRG